MRSWINHTLAKTGAGESDDWQTNLERRPMRDAVNAEGKAGNNRDIIATKSTDEMLAGFFAVLRVSPRADDAQKCAAPIW